MLILEEGNLPHPQCPMCDMLVPWWDLNVMHWRTAQFRKGGGQKRRRLAAEEERLVVSRSFVPNGIPLEMVTSFKYLGRVISASDNDWPEVVRNMKKARAVWRRLKRIIIREGATPWVSGFFFKSVVQSVLLFSAETWVVIPRMSWLLLGVPVPGGDSIDREAPMPTDRRKM